MAVNKNFVVKNGLEVNNSLILADADTNKVGIGSTAPRTELDVRGGIAVTHAYITGIATVLTDLNVGTDGTTLSAIGSSVGIGVSLPQYLLDVRTTFGGETALFVQGNASINGDIESDNVNITGISTLGTVKINSGIVTATSGIVTYYGDGSKLSGIGIGIHSSGTVVGSGATTLDFRGSGFTTALYDSSVGVATIFFEKGSVSIGSEAPYNPENGGLWYSTVFGRTYIYYDEVALGIGSTAVWVDSAPFNTGLLDTNALSAVTLSVSEDITTVRNINATGIVTAANFDNVSDRNLKTNIQTVDNALDIVGNLRGVSFDWKSNGNPSYGVIAQELEQVLPELVSDGNPKAVSYNGIIGVLIEAVKELKEEVEELKKSK